MLFHLTVKQIETKLNICGNELINYLNYAYEITTQNVCCAPYLQLQNYTTLQKLLFFLFLLLCTTYFYA